MRMRRLRLEFGMELRSEYPRMPFYFHDFHEVALWIYSRNFKPRVFSGLDKKPSALDLLHERKIDIVVNIPKNLTSGELDNS